MQPGQGGVPVLRIATDSGDENDIRVFVQAKLLLNHAPDLQVHRAAQARPARRAHPGGRMTITGGNAEAREQHQRRRQARAAAEDEPQRKRARLQTRAVLARLARAQEERPSAGSWDNYIAGVRNTA